MNDKKVELKSMRDGFGDGLVEAARENDKVVGLTADLRDSVKMDKFAEEFGDRFFDVGVAEQNLVTVASGLAAVGKVPVAASYSVFMPGRSWEQIRTTIAYNDQPVILVGSHGGLNVGPDGATHQALEDIAMMRVLPNMIVLAPCDYYQARRAIKALSVWGKPAYLRLEREKSPVMTDEEGDFMIGVGQVMRSGKKVTIVACGSLVYEAMLAAEEVDGEVINMHTIKPLDESVLIESVRKTGRVVTVEDHQVAGGLGGAVAEVLGEKLPTPMGRVGVRDVFGESGKASELREKYGLTAEVIVEKCRELMR